MTTVALGVGLLALAVVLYWLGVAVHGALEGRRFQLSWATVSRFLDGPWWRVAAAWWVGSTVLYVAGSWVFYLRLDGPRYRAGDCVALAVFWVIFSGVLVAVMAVSGRKASKP